MSDIPSKSRSGQPIKLLLSDVNFLAVWSIGGITGVVRWFQLLAFGVYTYETTGSPFLVSTIPILWMLPLTLFGPIVGVLADQISRKLLLISSIGAITLIQLFMATAAFHGDLSYLMIAIVLSLIHI